MNPHIALVLLLFSLQSCIFLQRDEIPLRPGVSIDEDTPILYRTGELSISFRREFLFNTYDVVVYGEIEPITDHELTSIMTRKVVQANFHVEQVFKNSLAGMPENLTIYLDSDMLVSPSKDISRFQERLNESERIRNVRRNLWDQRANLEAQLESDPGNGGAYRNRLQVIDAQLDNASSAIDRLRSPMYAISHWEHFFELDGVISPGRKYLFLGKLNEDDSEASFHLSVLSDSAVVWGEYLENYELVLDYQFD